MSQEQIQVPKGWKIATLEEMAKQEKGSIRRGPWGGSILKSDFVQSGYKVYQQKNVIYNDFEFGNYFIDKEKYNELISFALKPGDFVISYAGTAGKIAIVPNDAKEGVMNQNLLKITLDENKVNTFFLKYFFESNLFKTESAKLIRGSAMEAFLPTRQLIKYKIPLPPIPIQKKIVQKLDDVLGQLEGKKKAVFSIIEQNKEKIGFFEKNWFTYIIDREIENHPKRNDWKIKTVKELFYIKGRIGWRGLKKADFTTEGPFLITGVNIMNGGITWKNSYHIPMDKFLESPEIILEKDDILLTKDGTIGKVAYINDIPGGKASLNAHIHLIRNIENNNIFPWYTFYILHSNRFLSYVKAFQSGSTRPSLPQKLFENFIIPLPPIPIQKQIVQNIKNAEEKFKSQKTQFENIKENYENSITYVNHIQSSILDAAFSGKLVQ